MLDSQYLFDSFFTKLGQTHLAPNYSLQCTLRALSHRVPYGRHLRLGCRPDSLQSAFDD